MALLSALTVHYEWEFPDAYLFENLNQVREMA